MNDIKFWRIKMSGKSRIAGKFKSKGENILRGQQPGPGSMEDFLKDTQNHKDTIPHLHESLNPQKDNSTNDHFLKVTNYPIHKSSKEQKHKLRRLHIQIRQDLLDKLLDIVFKRKLDPKIKNRNATQRVVIEEALECYFIKNDIVRGKQKWQEHIN
jgi:hypothetical protein